MKTFALWFFLLNGSWTPGWYLDGWAPPEVSGGIVACEALKAEVEGLNQEYKQNPSTGVHGIEGEVSGVYVKCLQVFYPKDDKPV